MNDCEPISEPSIVEIVYTWPDGRDEVRYRRTFGSFEANVMIKEVDELKRRNGDQSPYSYRYL